MTHRDAPRRTVTLRGLMVVLIPKAIRNDFRSGVTQRLSLYLPTKLGTKVITLYGMNYAFQTDILSRLICQAK